MARMTGPCRETDLYPPIKAFLESQGYEVKSEIGAADVVALHPGVQDEDPLIVELKTGFSLSLIHQAVQRQAISDTVYIAAPHGRGKPFMRALKNMTALCRRLGVGLITVRLRDALVQVHCDPAPYRPRPAPRRRAALLKEFARRVGDPNSGGATRRGLITAYRQDALRCLHHLNRSGPSKGAEVARETQIAHARRLMADNHYGWFIRVERGIYALSPQGVAALDAYGPALPQPAAGD